MERKRVAVGLSGGVDSAVAALLLKREGYDVIGLFMRNWEETDGNGVCAADDDFEDVKRVADHIGIPYYSVNFSKEYMDRVFSYFLREYAAGRTPNPDVLCNREIKFGPFRAYAKSLGADLVATGHYCGISHENGVHRLLKARDGGKDQTYFLCQLTQPQLEDVLFPLAKLTKTEVREIAAREHLPTAEKKDSTGICFIGERNFRNFLKTYFPACPGEIRTLSGEKVGEHIGLMYYTLGQRRGLELGGRQGGDGRWFVVEKDLKNNVLYVSQGDETPLYSTGCILEETNYIPTMPEVNPFKCRVKLRYRQSEQGATLFWEEGGRARLLFDEPQRAVTEGQFAVFYDETACLGGGVVVETFGGIAKKLS